MHLAGIWLQHFRNAQDLVVQFSPTVTILVGENGTGKTSVLEAIHLASLGESFRAGKAEEMISFDAQYARVQLRAVDETGDTTTIETMVTNGSVQGKKTPKRIFSVNGVRRRRKDVVGLVKTVLFRPEDLRLIEGSPSRRRSYLDHPLSLQDWHYAQALKTYDQTLRQRNKLLEQIREGQARLDGLPYWDSQLVTHGQYLQRSRQEYLEKMAAVEFPREFTIHYVPSLISQARLEEYRSRSIAAGHTLIGPHKDDFRIDLAGRDVAAFGSRGQQRLAVLWLKIGERSYLWNGSSQPAGTDASHQNSLKPILLLDDIFSELDHEAQKMIHDLMKDGQTVVTSADQQVATGLGHLYANSLKFSFPDAS